jgi:hypothetical protein
MFRDTIENHDSFNNYSKQSVFIISSGKLCSYVYGMLGSHSCDLEKQPYSCVNYVLLCIEFQGLTVATLGSTAFTMWRHATQKMVTIGTCACASAWKSTTSNETTRLDPPEHRQTFADYTTYARCLKNILLVCGYLYAHTAISGI